MNILLKHAITSALAIGLGLSSMASSAAVPLLDFTVDETSNGLGGTHSAVVLDKINGGYSEQVVFSGGNFDTQGFGSFTQFFKNDGQTPVPVSDTDITQTYGMYSLFATFDGVVGSPAPGITSFTGGTGWVELWLDPDQNTTLDFTGVTGGGTDDIMVAFSDSLLQQAGLLTGVGGFFDLIFGDVVITNPEGQAYFTDLPLINLKATVDGDFDSFTPAGTQTVVGDASIVFQVPEPSVLALMGIGLMGAGLGRRKQA